MEWIRVLLSRVASLFRRRRLDAELDEELHAHIELAIAENLRNGISPDQARTAALRALGGVTQTRETYRVQRGLPWLEQIARDVRFGLRQLAKSPGFTLTAILTLMIGLGANTAVFSLINALLLRPLPVPHAEELAVLHIDRSDDQDGPSYDFSAPVVRALEKRQDVFQNIAGFTWDDFQIRGSSGNVEVIGAEVSGQFFSVMEARPLLGRLLTPQDDQPGGTAGGFPVVISESFWRTWFNRTPDVLGRRITIDNAPFTIVGVMPKGFIGADSMRPAQIYAPLAAGPVIDAPYDNITAGVWWLSVIARRRQGVSLEQANAALRATAGSLLDEAVPDAEWIKDAREHHFQLAAESGSTGYTYLRARFRKPIIAVFWLCTAMLLLACLNLASLLMARSAARERELATRLAMGATRRRLVQQLLVESMIIATLGTAAGLLLAPFVNHALVAYVLANSHGATLDVDLDLRVLVFVALAGIISTVAVGLIPALRATSGNLNEQIKSGSLTASSREHRSTLPRILLGLEVALALMLVFGAGLLATSLTRLYRVGLGFDPRGVVNIDLDMYKQSLAGEALVHWYQTYGDALRHLPGVGSVSFAQITPLGGEFITHSFRTPLSGGDRTVHINLIAPDYFQTMRIPILGGRDFRWSDTLASGRKIILNQSAARELFPGQNPLGQQIRSSRGPLEVIAVAGDTHYESLRENSPPAVYYSITQNPNMKQSSYTAVVRTEGSPASLADFVRALTTRMAPDIPAPIMTKMSSVLDASISSERMMAMLAVFFAVCALLVTAIGLYGTLAYATARRTSEIGIRIALGAQRVQVVAMVFRENAWIAAGGSLLGLVIALLASRALASFLYGTSVRDPWVLVASVAALTFIASAASLIPAIRAARIEPITALRLE